jgi:hypothetical protein
MVKIGRFAAASLLPRDGSGRRGLIASATISAVCVAGAVWFSRPLLRNVSLGRIGSTSGLQFEAAANWVLCGRYGQVASTGDENRKRINMAEIRDASAYAESTIAFIQWHVGSRFAYCSQSTSTVIAEPGMILLFAAVIAANRNAALTVLATELALARIILIWTFIWFLLRAGYSLPFAAVTAGLAVYLVILQGGNQLYAAYAFILPVVLAGIALAGVAIQTRTTKGAAIGFFALGVWAGFLGNLRTSHYPMALACIGAALLVARFSSRRALTAFAAAAIGVILFDRAFIAPLRAGGANTNHTISHSLVIGLSYPPNDLARREGIQWDDAVGPVIARRLSPNVALFGRDYERVLFSYYGNLWRAHPSEMLSIYRAKLWSTGDSLFSWLGDNRGNLFWDRKDDVILPWVATLVRPIVGLSTLGGLMVFVTVAGIMMLLRWGPAVGWPAIALGVTGLLGFAEASIILGSVALWYSAVLVFATLVAGVLPCELIARAIVCRSREPKAA